MYEFSNVITEGTTENVCRYECELCDCAISDKYHAIIHVNWHNEPRKDSIDEQ